MARGTYSSANYLRLASAPVTAMPLTLACWANTSTLANPQALLALIYTAGSAAIPDGWGLALEVTTGRVKAQALDGVGGSVAFSATGLTAATWNHCAAVFNSATSRYAYLNGAIGSENTTSRIPTTPGTTTIGSMRNQNNSHWESGVNSTIAEVGFWNVALTTAEILQLAAGYSPLFIRPSGLVAYWPLIRGDASGDEPDYRAALKMVEQGTVAVQTHPRRFYPAPRHTITRTPVAAPAFLYKREESTLLRM